MHLGFNCKDLEKSIWWYETFLGCKEKFTLYWGDLMPKNEEMRARMDPERIQYLEGIKDEKWIVYMEVMDCPGTFIELFNEPTAHVPHLPDQEVDLNYTHYAHTVDDVQAFYESVLAKGGEEYEVTAGSFIKFILHHPNYMVQLAAYSCLFSIIGIIISITGIIIALF